MTNSTENEALIIWNKPEHTHHEKTMDWYWALGIIVICGSVASIIYENYFFAIILVMSGVLMGYMAGKHPEDVRHELGEKGLLIGKSFFPYESIIAFWVRNKDNPKLFLKTKKVFDPHLSIPIDEEQAQDIQNAFLNAGVKEEEMREHPTEKIMELIGF